MIDSVTQWLNAAGRYPVLSPDETIRIGKLIQASEPGSAQHTKYVNKLCVHNLRLVTRFARSYFRNKKDLRWSDCRMADYLQQGYFGLRRAAEKFDPERGYTFSTYAAAWIRQALGRYHVENISMVRVPESSAREIFYYDNHGKPRNGKVASWVPDASRAAKAAYSITSYDGMSVDMETNLSEVLSDENRLIRTTEDGPRTFVDTNGIMSSLGIDPRIQDLVNAYIKRGNLDTVLMKNKCCSRETRQKVRGAIKLIQDHCGAAVG